MNPREKLIWILEAALKCDLLSFQEALSFAMSNYDVFFLIENISEETKDLLQYCDSLGFLTLNGNTYRCSDITTEAAYDQITSPD